MNFLKSILIFGICALVLATCGGPRPFVLNEALEAGDREREWALVYFLSWRKERDGRYLRLSRSYMKSAIDSYLRIQTIIGHSWPDFYDIDKRRLQSCNFLRRIDNDASRHGVALTNRSRDGCFS